MRLDGNTLSVAVLGEKPYEYDPFTDVDRSEPLVLAAFLKGSTLTISKFSVSSGKK
jgi:hypothetical protein